MLTLIRRAAIFIFIVILIGCVILLLNITAQNPTGRRYASASPPMWGEENVTPNELGAEAERILAIDLNVPNNNAANQRQCICNIDKMANRKACRSCLLQMNLSAEFGRPDFVTQDFIADSKNQHTLGDFEQLEDYATAAKQLNMPLWVYVRVNTTVHSSYETLIESTGGGVVYYFPTPGYHDPVDIGAGVGVLVCSASLTLLTWGEFRTYKKSPAAKVVKVPLKDSTPLEDAEELARRIKGKD